MFGFRKNLKSKTEEERKTQQQNVDAKYDIKRIIVCVDGTWYNADGREGKGNGNVSNTFRIYASIKPGTFKQNGKVVHQVRKYFQGIGVNTKTKYDKFNDAITGEGCNDLIRDVYRYCCDQLTSPNDELWLFGFSRGAYVVRSVAALFHELSAIQKTITGEFNTDYKHALEFLRAKKKGQLDGHVGRLYHLLQEKIRQGPIIQFLGLFDTVKKHTKGDPDHDLSLKHTVLHVRHALALNESRAAYHPEIYQTDPRADWPANSLVQAWFVGRHIDMGGGAKHDGLALYPLQWMLQESQKYGLVLQYQPDKWIAGDVTMQHPPKLVLPGVFDESGIFQPYTQALPSQKQGGGSIWGSEGKVDQGTLNEWAFTVNNGVAVTMYDLRPIHKQHGPAQGHGNRLQKGGASEPATHQVRLDPPMGVTTLGGTRSRSIIGPEGLIGYNRKVPYGTIIHPSAYFLLNTYPDSGLREDINKLEKEFDAFSRELEPDDPDLKRQLPWLMERKSGASQHVRILICGRTGVGKSTLLNRIFGIDLTDVKKEGRGIHDIDQGFSSDHVPGIIIHDSQGFEAGDLQRVQDFERFLIKRGSSAFMKDELHAVWVCNEMSTDRPFETAFATIFNMIARFAPNLPVVYIGTKKDRFLKADSNLSHSEVTELAMGKASQKAQEMDISRDKERQVSWKRQFEAECDEASKTLKVKWAFVWQDNDASIKKLVDTTQNMLPKYSARAELIRMQVLDRDSKMALAVEKTMELLRTAVTASNCWAMTIFFKWVAVPTFSRILCDTIVQCYGLAEPGPFGTNEQHIDYIMSTVVWRNMAAFAGRSFLAMFGGASALFVGAPFIEAPVVVRMMVKCACDLIIILDRAYQIGGREKAKENIHSASSEYVHPTYNNLQLPPRKQAVHQDIKKLVPVISLLAVTIFQKEKSEELEAGILEIVKKHRMKNLNVYSQRPDGAFDMRNDSELQFELGQDDSSTLFGDDDDDLREWNSMGPKDDERDLDVRFAGLDVSAAR